MPRDETLRGYDIDVRKMVQPVRGEGEELAMSETWVLAFMDRESKDRIFFEMDDETKGELVRKLTGGLHLPV